MDAQDKQRLNDLEFKMQGMAQRIADLEKIINEKKPQRDTSASPRPQRQTDTFERFNPAGTSELGLRLHKHS